MGNRPPFISVVMLSASALGSEILLMHLFSVIRYHHFAYMVISLALLGYGMSGTILFILREHLSRYYSQVYLGCIVLFGITVVGAFLLAQEIPFNGEEIFWDRWQIVYLVAQFFLLSLPFFFAATAIGLTLSVYPDDITAIYGCDLAGAGVGTFLVLLVMFVFLPIGGLVFICCLGLFAALIGLWEMNFPRPGRVVAGVLGLAVIVGVVGGKSELKISQYKSLMNQLRVEGSRVVERFSSPLGFLHVVENNKIPFRHAPGLSLNALQEPLPQMAVFTNGDNVSVITEKPKTWEELGYFDQITSALPYNIAKIKNGLFLGVGGGADIIGALSHGGAEITGVELNPQMISLLLGKYAEYSGFGSIFDPIIYSGDMRGFIDQNKKKFDLIQLSMVDSFSPSTSGLYSVNENYLYTVEALQGYLEDLSTGGILSITRWIKNPPRDTLKLFATAVEVLKKTGVEKIEQRLLLIRSWQTSTLLIKNSDFSLVEIRDAEKFCNERGFDISYSFLVTEDQVNSYNVLKYPMFFRGTQALVSEQAKLYIENYKFNILPPTDDQPYFHHFFKWSSFKEILSLRNQGGAALVESGYLVLLVSLVVATILSFVLIVAPLALCKRLSIRHHHGWSLKSVVSYFFLAGLVFFFMEIAIIQRFTLYLHHPVYSVTVCLGTFLIFAGAGSSLSKKLRAEWGAQKVMLLSTTGVACLGLAFICFLSDLFSITSSFTLTARMACSVALISPLALMMGMPFPLGLGCLSDDGKEMIPWAWGINGCASVVGAMSATLIAIHWGFSSLLFVAIIIYPAMYLLFPDGGDQS